MIFSAPEMSFQHRKRRPHTSRRVDITSKPRRRARYGRLSSIDAVAPESERFCVSARYAAAVPCGAVGRARVARILDYCTVKPMSSVAAPLAGPSSRAGSARSTADNHAVVATVAWTGLCALVVTAPFEALKPLITLPGQSLSSVEAVMLAVLGVWALGLVSARTLPVWRAPLTLPWLGFIFAMLAAALLAPTNRGNALNMVGRLALGFAVYLLTVNAVNSVRRLIGACVVIGVSAALVWPLLLLEHAQVGWVNELLSVFRSQPANVGAALRASGPFLYPTIASMYLEIAFALTLGTFLTLADRRHDGRAIWSGLLLFAIGQSITLTSSRAGLALIVASVAVVSALRLKRVGFDLCAKSLLALLALIGIQLPTTHSFENLTLRLTTEGQNAWYRASFEVPHEVSIPTGETILVPIRVTNTGRTVWNSAVTPPFRLSYHLLLEDDRVSSWQGLRTDFPHPVQPGESISLNAAVEAPMKPGRYRVMWDIERENWLWFSTEPGAALFVTEAVVTGPEIGPVGEPHAAKLPTAPSRPGRLVLWRAALGMFARAAVERRRPRQLPTRIRPVCRSRRFRYARAQQQHVPGSARRRGPGRDCDVRLVLSCCDLARAHDGENR